MTSALPDTDFAALAFELRLMARREAASNEIMEAFVARTPTLALKRTLSDLQDSAKKVGQAAMLIALMARHEDAVRAFLASLETRLNGVGTAV